MREGIPDLRYEILDLVATGEKAAVYLRVTGMGATLRVLGQSLGGDFVFEQLTTAGQRRVVRAGG